MSSTKDEQSAKRTDWSEDRTIMSNERTFSSWIGSGMGAIGVAIGLKAVFGAFEPTWAAKSVASIFIVIAICIFFAARHNVLKTLQRLSENDAKVSPGKNYTFITFGLSFGAICVGGILWSL